MISFRVLLMCVLAVVPRTAFANAYDECVLQYMNGAKDKTAVYAIERACISKVSVSVQSDQLTDFAASIYITAVGSFNIWSLTPSAGFLVKIVNVRLNPISSISFFLVDKKTKVISHFPVTRFVEPLPPNVISSGPGEPMFEQIIPPGTSRTFFVAADGLGNNWTASEQLMIGELTR